MASLSINQKQSAFKSHHSTETALQARRSLTRSTVLSTKSMSNSSLPWIYQPLSMLWITVQSCVVWNTHSAYLAPCWTGSDPISLSVNSSWSSGFVVRSAYVANLACTGFGTRSNDFRTLRPPVAVVIEDFGFKHHQYADDTQLFISLDRSNIQKAIESTREISDMVQRWFQENGLLLNLDKSEAIHLGTG